MYVPGAVYCCFNKNYKVYKIFDMTLHSEPHMFAKFHGLHGIVRFVSYATKEEEEEGELVLFGL